MKRNSMLYILHNVLFSFLFSREGNLQKTPGYLEGERFLPTRISTVALCLAYSGMSRDSSVNFAARLSNTPLPLSPGERLVLSILQYGCHSSCHDTRGYSWCRSYPTFRNPKGETRFRRENSSTVLLSFRYSSAYLHKKSCRCCKVFQFGSHDVWQTFFLRFLDSHHVSLISVYR